MVTFQPPCFGTFEQVEGMLPCRKKPITVYSKKIDYEFRVNSMEGNYKEGQPGDYLMRGIDGELYICAASIFERSYDVLSLSIEVVPKPANVRANLDPTA